MAHRPKTNNSVENLNRRIFAWFVEKLSNYFMSAYTWENFPFDSHIYGQVIDYLDYKLLYNGRIAFTYIEDFGTKIPIMGTFDQNSRKTWYNGSFQYTITTETNTYLKNIDDIALCYNTPSKLPFINTVNIYADMLAKTFLAMRVNVDSQNTPAIIRAPSGQELTYANAYEQVAGHKPVVYGRDNAFSDEKSFFYLTPGQYVADKLWTQITNVLNMFFFELGVSPLPFEKKAQVQTEEINITKQALDISGNVMLDSRKQFCKAINELYGLNTDVRLNITSEFSRMQAEAIINENPFAFDVRRAVDSGFSNMGQYTTGRNRDDRENTV